MPTSALDYSEVGAVCDAYCVYDHDLPFLEKLASETSGQILELMAGTGRISLPLAWQGCRLTCVDSSLAMLAVLGRK